VENKKWSITNDVGVSIEGEHALGHRLPFDGGRRDGRGGGRSRRERPRRAAALAQAAEVHARLEGGLLAHVTAAFPPPCRPRTPLESRGPRSQTTTKTNTLSRPTRRKRKVHSPGRRCRQSPLGGKFFGVREKHGKCDWSKKCPVDRPVDAKTFRSCAWRPEARALLAEVSEATDWIGARASAADLARAPSPPASQANGPGLSEWGCCLQCMPLVLSSRPRFFQNYTSIQQREPLISFAPRPICQFDDIWLNDNRDWKVNPIWIQSLLILTILRSVPGRVHIGTIFLCKIFQFILVMPLFKVKLYSVCLKIYGSFILI